MQFHLVMEGFFFYIQIAYSIFFMSRLHIYIDFDFSGCIDF